MREGAAGMSRSTHCCSWHCRHCRRQHANCRRQLPCEVLDVLPAAALPGRGYVLLTKAKVAGHGAIEVGGGGHTRLPQGTGGGLHRHRRPAGLQDSGSSGGAAGWWRETPEEDLGLHPGPQPPLYPIGGERSKKGGGFGPAAAPGHAQLTTRPVAAGRNPATRLEVRACMLPRCCKDDSAEQQGPRPGWGRSGVEG